MLTFRKLPSKVRELPLREFVEQGFQAFEWLRRSCLCLDKFEEIRRRDKPEKSISASSFDPI
jgi:hypothetical protein